MDSLDSRTIRDDIVYIFSRIVNILDVHEPQRDGEKDAGVYEKAKARRSPVLGGDAEHGVRPRDLDDQPIHDPKGNRSRQNVKEQSLERRDLCLLQERQ